jgi:hypothetical protein
LLTAVEPHSQAAAYLYRFLDPLLHILISRFL